ncbi:MAG: ABC transporter ATP-binding protein [Chloroflexaceae bacterium]|nr:ABC transporter ATP-binding protein [Chloroflexaceae bacterium]
MSNPQIYRPSTSISTPASSLPVIEFDRVSKRFALQHDGRVAIHKRVANLLRGRQHLDDDSFWALRDVSFTMRRGETIGLIGHNGSGKSTTLKLITRILEPTSGRVAVHGRVSALLELGSGFHPDLTGRENIYLNGSLLGQSHADMRRKIAGIIDFSELGDFIDTPVKHYSSGMYMRLAFAIAISVDPDILITDEILAVGDDAFQRKCIDQIYRFKRQGRTILFVSHALGLVQNLCDRALWFDHGVLRCDGDTVQSIDTYLCDINERDRKRIEEERRRELEERDARDAAEGASGGEGADDEGETERPTPNGGSREVEIVRVELLDRAGKEREVFDTGETLTVRVHYRAHEQVDYPVFGLAIHHRSGIHINGPNTRFANYPIDVVEGEGTVEYTIESLPLLEGEYLLTAAVYDYTMSHPYDHHERKYPFRVQVATVRERYGLLYIPGRWEWNHGATTPGE